MLHAGFQIDDQDLLDSGAIRVVDLPEVEVAATVYRGGVEGITPAWGELVR